MKIDRYDRKILEVLQQDGRISNQDLAERIGLSQSPCLRRVRALEESGLITGYRALVDAKKLGLSLLALIHISMDRHTPERFNKKSADETSRETCTNKRISFASNEIIRTGTRPSAFSPAMILTTRLILPVCNISISSNTLYLDCEVTASATSA